MEQYLRFDSGHHGLSTGSPGAKNESCSEDAPPWLVVVRTLQELAAEQGGPEEPAAVDQEGRLLLVVCGEGDRQNAMQDNSVFVEQMAARLHLPYRGDIAPDDENELLRVLADVKQSGNSSLLYLDTAGRAPSPHFESPGREPTSDQFLVRRYRDLAISTLRELKAVDDRIVFFCTDASFHPEVVQPGTGVVAALAEECTQLAAEGQRPYLFVSLDEALDELGVLRRAMTVAGSSLTLVIEHRYSDSNPARSSQLVAFREIAGVNLLAPKDGQELRDMLQWCSSEPGPSIIWLSEVDEPPVTWPAGEPVARGRAERLGGGGDVTLVAWGSMNAVAAIAAEHLAQLGIRPTVVNARFLQPLDVEAFEAVCRESAYTVLLDDCSAGGFAGLVGEHLVRRGGPVSFAIVSPELGQAPSAWDTHDALATRIVDRCRWLGEHLTEDTVAPMSAVSTVVAPRPPVVPPMTSERAAAVRAQVIATPLSSDVRRWASQYEEVGPRDVYLWQWCAHGVEITMLPSVSEQLRAHVSDTKVLSIILCVLLDDVADEHGDGHLLEALLGLTFGDSQGDFSALSGPQTRHAEITRSLWAEYWQRISNYPRFAQFEPVLRYDLQQFNNTMRYSHLINGHPYLLNVAEHDLYTSHNMMIVSFATLDLMCSPGFPLAQVGALREMAWHAQCMGRYGNLLSTWRRELANCDFTSGVFARALTQGDLSYEQLACQDARQIELTVRNRGHEAYFHERWLEHRRQCHACAGRISAVDLSPVLRGHDQFYEMHLSSEGLI